MSLNTDKLLKDLENTQGLSIPERIAAINTAIVEFVRPVPEMLVMPEYCPTLETFVSDAIRPTINPHQIASSSATIQMYKQNMNFLTALQCDMVLTEGQFLTCKMP
ncbi:hypothetical protein [Ewingella americana]|uniref:Uncharacterized protein n=1 Tax=Ewingella americana TaxID=41202 RepID=A0A502GEC2_9GAMM|nr:hypothetical protein [Ewingella americana]TPG59888.1 hypothetical protein EAH77_15085 [Ewingella americana]